MSDLKKPTSDLTAKFEIARSVDLPVVAPRTPVSPPASSAPNLPVVERHQLTKGHCMSLPFTYAFHESSHAKAVALAKAITCPVEDIILVIARRFDAQLLDLSVSTVQPRFGVSKRILLKIDQSIIDATRLSKDPLNVRSDGYLLRAPVIAGLDVIANHVLDELGAKYG